MLALVGVTPRIALAEKTVLMGGGPENQPQPRKRRMVTDLDEKKAGAEGAKAVAAQVGLLKDKKLDAYVQRIGDRLLRGLPRRSFQYKFLVVDQTEPNAFALPGGYVFISRGLLGLARSEDEIANVVGHEIAHVALHHSVRQQALQQHTNRLVMGYMRHAQMSSYGRDMERESDEQGQKLAAAAGYDPAAMASFMESLGQWTELETGRRRQANWFDSHPTTGERAAVNAVRANELRWKRDPSLGNTKTAHLHTIDGMPVGERPEAGIFEGDRFLHPDMDFQLKFPAGWRQSNTPVAVGAQSRNGSVVFLSGDIPPGKPRESAEKFAEKNDLKVRTSKADKVRGHDVWRVEAGVPGGHAYLMFLEHQRHTMGLIGMAPSFVQKDSAQIDKTLRSFRPLTADQRKAIRKTNLRIVKAEPGESLESLSRRSRNAWGRGPTAVANGVKWGHQFSGGELVKVADSQPYKAKP
jgi:predicted Zn-dependent protease